MCVGGFALSAACSGQGQPRPQLALKTRLCRQGDSQYIITNLFEAEHSGWLAIGESVADALLSIPTPHRMVIQKPAEEPWPQAEAVRVVLDDGHAGRWRLRDYASVDDVCRIAVDHPGVFCINAADAWVRLNGNPVPSVAGHRSVYVVPAEVGDEICFLSKAWAPRVLRLVYEGKPRPEETFPLQALTATEFDYGGVARVLAGELNALKFALCPRTTDPIEPEQFALVIETPTWFESVQAFGSADKTKPYRKYAVTTDEGDGGGCRHVISLAPFLSELAQFHQRFAGYPKTDFIGWACILVTFRVPEHERSTPPPLRWYLRGGDEVSRTHVLKTEVHRLLSSPSMPRTFSVHVSAGRLPCVESDAVGAGWAQLLRRCGVSAAVLGDPLGARRLKSVGIEPLFFCSYNEGMGGVNIKGKVGRVCPQKHILDGGDYFARRFFGPSAGGALNSLKQRVLGRRRRQRRAFSGLELDFEPRGSRPSEACFCADCRRAFSHWSGLDVATMSAERIWADHDRLWVAFRNWQYAEIFELYAQCVKRIDPNYRAYFNCGGGVMTSDAEARHLAENVGWRLEDAGRAVGLFSPYFYRNAHRFIDSFRFHQRFFSRARFAPWTATSYAVGTESHTLSAAALRQQMFIWFAMGAPCIRLWNENETGLDGLRLLTLQQTLGELARCEPYYAEGTAAGDVVHVSEVVLDEADDSSRRREFRPWQEIVQCCTHRRSDALAVTLFNLDPDSEGRPARVRLSVDPGGGEAFTVRDLLMRKGLLDGPVERDRLVEGIDVTVGPKDVLVLEIRRR